jgi:hypothetical protein
MHRADISVWRKAARSISLANGPAPDRQALWEELDASLRALIHSFAASLEEADLSLLHDFIDNREYGVGLDWLQSLLDERSIETSHEQREEMARLAALMGLPGP